MPLSRGCLVTPLRVPVVSAHPGLPAGGAFCINGSYAASRASGADARAFLNGQLSSDVRTLAADRWQLSSYSTPKGRALATFVLAAPAPAGSGERFWLVTRRSVAGATFRRLAMFVLRSKVSWSHETHAVVGVCGASGRAALAELLAGEPPAAAECRTLEPQAPLCGLIGGVLADPALSADAASSSDPRVDGGGDAVVIGLGHEAWWLLVPLAALDAVAGALRATLPEIGAARWDAIEVAAGRPWVESGTVESFVPQMLNLDLTGGISFKKGCYPGQEIVARTQYLGKVKRRMLRLAFVPSAGAALPDPGTPVLASGDAAQAVGEVVLAAPLDAQRGQLLAVLQMDLAAGADLHLGDAGGPALQPLDLPYPLEAG